MEASASVLIGQAGGVLILLMILVLLVSIPISLMKIRSEIKSICIAVQVIALEKASNESSEALNPLLKKRLKELADKL